MRRACLALPGLLAAVLVGCISGPAARPTASWLRPNDGPVGPDVVVMDYALLEAPLGEEYIDRGVWAEVDGQVVDSQVRAAVEDNGFRVGQVGGNPPARLQKMIETDRFCAVRHRRRFRAGERSELLIGDPAPRWDGELHRDGKTTPVQFEQVQCQFQLTARFADGRIRLHCEPQVLHGDRKTWPQLTALGANWLEERATERYPDLAWDVTLAPNEYLIVGSRYSQLPTVGGRFFLAADAAKPVQRLLVLRTGRAGAPPGESPAGPAATVPPLAYQAASYTARGSQR
jgi:hypothetical protein